MEPPAALPVMRFRFQSVGWERRERDGVSETWRLDRGGKSTAAERDAYARLRASMEAAQQNARRSEEKRLAGTRREREHRAEISRLEAKVVQLEADLQRKQGLVPQVGTPCSNCVKPLVAERTPKSASGLICDGGKACPSSLAPTHRHFRNARVISRRLRRCAQAANDPLELRGVRHRHLFELQR